MLNVKITLLYILFTIKGFINGLFKEVEAKGRNNISTTKLVKKIFKFCELYSGITFYPYQEQFSKRIIRSVLENDGAEITALFSRQSGKSETVATTVGGLMIILPKLATMPMFKGDKRLERFEDGFTVGIFAPSQRQAQVTYGRMKSRLQCENALTVLSDPDFRLEFSTSNGQTVALTNGSFATAISASDGSNIEGESFKFIIMEEAQDISDFKIKKSIIPMGSAYNSTICLIGTATTHKGYFYEAIARNKQMYEQGNLQRRNHLEFDYKIASKYNESYRKFVKKQKVRLGEHSDEFRMSYKLEWILTRGMFINGDNFEKLNGDPDANRVYVDKDKKHIAGIDLAKKNDSTVVTIVEVDWDNPVIVEESEHLEEPDYKAYETRIKDWLEIQGDDYEAQYHQIVEYLKNFNVGRVMIDATAEGSFADRMNAHLPIQIVPVVFGTKTKSQMYKHLDTEIKSGRAKFPNGDEAKETREHNKFLEQMYDLEKNYKGQHMVVSHPNRRGARDDYADSWALAVYGSKAELEIDETATRDGNPFYDSSNKNKFYNKRNRLTARRR